MYSYLQREIHLLKLSVVKDFGIQTLSEPLWEMEMFLTFCQTSLQFSDCQFPAG